MPEISSVSDMVLDRDLEDCWVTDALSDSERETVGSSEDDPLTLCESDIVSVTDLDLERI